MKARVARLGYKLFHKTWAPNILSTVDDIYRRWEGISTPRDSCKGAKSLKLTATKRP